MPPMDRRPLPDREPQRRRRPRGEAAPAGGSALRARGSRSRSTAPTPSPTRTSSSGGRRGGRDGRRDGRRRADRRVAGELRGHDAVLGVIPGGRGNDFARKLGIGGVERACDVLATGSERWSKSGRRRPHLPRHRVGRFRLGRQRDRQRQQAPAGRANSTSTRSSARCADGDRHLRVVVGHAHGFDGYSVAWRTPAFRRRHVPRSRRGARRRLLDVVLTGAAPKRRFLANLPRVFKGTHVNEPMLTFLRGREIAFHADRPFSAYATATRSPTFRTVRVVPAALRVLAPWRCSTRRPRPRTPSARSCAPRGAAAARAAGQGAHAPGAARDEMLGERLAHGSAVIQRHQREDDDRRDGRVGARA